MKKYIHLFIAIFLFAACKKEESAPLTQPVDFTGTSYNTLGTFDNTGKPNYLLTKDIIAPAFIAFINDTLPEDRNLRAANSPLLESRAIADIDITQPSDVLITFVSQGAASFKNSLAFYTYNTSNPPDSAKEIETITYIFPHVGYQSPLRAGDKVKIGRFNPGTTIGFVLLQNAFNTSTAQLNNNAVHFCSNDVLNPEIDPSLKKHAVLINYAPENKVLIGFEDLDRTTARCDHDFNDVVIYATVTP
jgi:hypothetical protein